MAEAPGNEFCLHLRSPCLLPLLSLLHPPSSPPSLTYREERPSWLAGSWKMDGQVLYKCLSSLLLWMGLGFSSEVTLAPSSSKLPHCLAVASE